MVGTYRMTFDAKHPESGACGSTSSDGNSGGTCSAFIKVLIQVTLPNYFLNKQTQLS